ncbi:hypothetical protein OSCI_1630021 [Kamptonema sp. PCC 6506]|nr:hypothetical protein OSCI_1630021 [Kamptonema sp. PCC 6506]
MILKKVLVNTYSYSKNGLIQVSHDLRILYHFLSKASQAQRSCEGTKQARSFSLTPILSLQCVIPVGEKKLRSTMK